MADNAGGSKTIANKVRVQDKAQKALEAKFEKLQNFSFFEIRRQTRAVDEALERAVGAHNLASVGFVALVIVVVIGFFAAVLVFIQIDSDRFSAQMEILDRLSALEAKKQRP